MMNEFRRGSRPCHCTERFHATRLVAITGGPGAGKTAVLELALRSFCTHIGAVPEAASVVFGGGFPRHDTDVARRAAQRAIFAVQREMETVAVGERVVAVALCDRGTVDGVAYWPDEPSSYWEAVGADPVAELARYAAVIHLRSPSAGLGYNRDYALRVESASEAAILDARTDEAWAAHPDRTVIEADEDFLHKAATALDVIRRVLPACCHTHRLEGVGAS